MCRECNVPIMMECYDPAGPGHTAGMSIYVYTAAICIGKCRLNNFGNGAHVTNWHVNIKVSYCDNI